MYLYIVNVKNMAKNINSNGFDYVDLGLPSGTLWATQNVGASKPSDYGLYFQWGDADGYTADQVGFGSKQKKFADDFSDYKWYLSGEGIEIKFKKYTTKGATLELEDDAAHVNMGGNWHMPTPTQIQELIDNTTNTWETLDGVGGKLFTSKKDTSTSIFIPTAGCASHGSFKYNGSIGYVWSSILSTFNVFDGQYFYFGLSDFPVGQYEWTRSEGLSVRGVLG